MAWQIHIWYILSPEGRHDKEASYGVSKRVSFYFPPIFDNSHYFQFWHLCCHFCMWSFCLEKCARDRNRYIFVAFHTSLSKPIGMHCGMSRGMQCGTYCGMWCGMASNGINAVWNAMWSGFVIHVRSTSRSATHYILHSISRPTTLSRLRSNFHKCLKLASPVFNSYLVGGFRSNLWGVF